MLVWQSVFKNERERKYWLKALPSLSVPTGNGERKERDWWPGSHWPLSTSHQAAQEERVFLQGFRRRQQGLWSQWVSRHKYLACFYTILNLEQVELRQLDFVFVILKTFHLSSREFFFFRSLLDLKHLQSPVALIPHALREDDLDNWEPSQTSSSILTCVSGKPWVWCCTKTQSGTSSGRTSKTTTWSLTVRKSSAPALHLWFGQWTCNVTVLCRVEKHWCDVFTLVLQGSLRWRWSTMRATTPSSELLALSLTEWLTS